jgi:hypothetical protein
VVAQAGDREQGEEGAAGDGDVEIGGDDRPARVERDQAVERVRELPAAQAGVGEGVDHRPDEGVDGGEQGEREEPDAGRDAAGQEAGVVALGVEVAAHPGERGAQAGRQGSAGPRRDLGGGVEEREEDRRGGGEDVGVEAGLEAGLDRAGQERVGAADVAGGGAEPGGQVDDEREGGGRAGRGDGLGQ